MERIPMERVYAAPWRMATHQWPGACSPELRRLAAEDAADAVDQPGDVVREERVGHDDRRGDDAEDDGVLGHRLGLLAAAGTDPAEESHITASARSPPGRMPRPGDPRNPPSVRSYG